MATADSDPRALLRLSSRQRSYDNLKDAAADYIRTAIVSGDLAPRSKVDQDAIAGALGISRVPVREALIELAQKDFVVAIPRRGAFVGELRLGDIEDHYEVVSLVFGVATKRAVKMLTPADLAELHALHEEISSTDDAARREELDYDFLKVIARVGSTRRLDSIMRFLGGALAGSFYLESPEWVARETRYRTLLLPALEARDVEAAVRITEDHLRGCAALAIEVLRSRGYWADEA
jgi:DNA-binding GntR family transcriptional regulator